MKRILIIFVLMCMATAAMAQSFTYSYTNPCNGNVERIVIPAGSNSVAVTYYNQIKVFNEADFSNGTFDAWANSVFNSYSQVSPCAGIGTSTVISLTQNTAMTMISIMGSLTTISDALGSVNSLGGLTSSVASGSGGSSSSGDSKKTKSNGSGKKGSSNSSNGSSESNGSNTTGGQGTSGSTTGSAGGSTQSSTGGSQSQSGSTQGGSSPAQPSVGGSAAGSGSGSASGSTATGGSGSNTGSTGGSSSGSTSGSGSSTTGGSSAGSSTTSGSGSSTTSGSGSGSGSSTTGGSTTGSGSSTTSGSGSESSSSGTPKSETTTASEDKKTDVLSGSNNAVRSTPTNGTGNSKNGLRPMVVAGSDLAGFNFKDGDIAFGGKVNGNYTSVRYDQRRSHGIIFDYTTAIKGPNITGFYAWMKPKRITLLSNTLTVGFEGKGSIYNSVAFGQMRDIGKSKKLKLVYMASASVGTVYEEAFLGTALIAGGMYDWRVSKKFDIKLMALGVYAPYVSYYNDILLQSPYVILPSIGTNIKVTKNFRFNVNWGGAWAINQSVLNYTITIGTRLVL
jgi:hypothetical protein